MKCARSSVPFLSSALLSLSLCTPVLAGNTVIDTSGLQEGDPLLALLKLGESVFFDENMSIPANKQGCVSCHDPEVGWGFKDVLGIGPAPGAHPGSAGTRKPPAAAYAVFSPVFDFHLGRGTRFRNCDNIEGPIDAACFIGGLFWDARAEGVGYPFDDIDEAYGAGAIPTLDENAVGLQCTEPSAHEFCEYLGPLADQAFGPFLNPVEQASRKKKVCQRVKTAPYKEFYRQAYNTSIDCRKQSLDGSYARIVLAVAAFEHSDKVNPFSSVREECLADDDGDGTIQGCSVDIMSEDAKAGHDLFYSFGGGAACSGCHNNLDEDFAGVNPNTEKNTYTDHSYHYLGVPYNRRIGYARGSDTGLNQHVTDPTLGIIPGEFKTPSLLNQAKGEEYKTYMHNGYFKTLKQVMHFYNTGTTKYCKDATEESAGDDWEEINARGLNTEFAWLNATIEEVWMEEGEDFQDNSDNVDDSYALCWPEPEFSRVDIPGIVGDRGLTPLQEDQVVAYLRALDDGDFVGFLADETSQATSGPPRGRGRR